MFSPLNVWLQESWILFALLSFQMWIKLLGIFVAIKNNPFFSVLSKMFTHFFFLCIVLTFSCFCFMFLPLCSEWYLNGNYLVIIVSIAVILPLALMKQLGECEMSWLCLEQDRVGAYFLLLMLNWGSYKAKQGSILKIWMQFFSQHPVSSAVFPQKMFQTEGGPQEKLKA